MTWLSSYPVSLNNELRLFRKELLTMLRTYENYELDSLRLPGR